MVDSLYYSSRKISERCENSFVNYRIYYQNRGYRPFFKLNNGICIYKKS